MSKHQFLIGIVCLQASKILIEKGKRYICETELTKTKLRLSLVLESANAGVKLANNLQDGMPQEEALRLYVKDAEFIQVMDQGMFT